MTDTTFLGSARLDRISVSAMDNNVYLLTAPSGEQLLVDAADDADAVLTLLAQEGPLRTVVTTHGHWDHHRALPAVVAATGARTAAGAADASDLPVPVDVLLAHGDRITVDSGGAVALDVVALRGHTPGSVALALTEEDGSGRPGRVHLFTGDSLFPGGVGKTRSPEDFTRLLDDVEQRLFAVYPDDTVVWPGHGRPTTLGAERPHLAEWRARGW
ncbi:MBL fold metallo-hydrolase [Georgenia sp. H159]|uniref:MBL fold metallo-hydrolase n=1 Tax=Georgenia sp. H159 TaxID=3076115 RepID=UPI002D793925|nr:MBL fold metallo-hydrolase [Georgenia sp. H159]